MLDVSNLTKRYGDILAVDDISFSVDDGELFSIVGPSGSGKSTVLRCIGGLETPEEGIITLDGEDVTGQRAYERDTAMVFQNLALFPHMTVRENVAYGMKRRGEAAETIATKIEEYLNLVDLSGYEDRRVDALSGGERQRVALARVLVVQPKLLLLDEPLASLDQQLRVQLQNELFDLQRQLDQTSIYVTHDQNVALSISDRVAVMNQAKIEQIGTPYDLYEHPKTEFVASFIGDSNRFEGTVTAVDGNHVQFQLDGSDVVLEGRTTDTNVTEGATVRGIVKLEDMVLQGTAEYPNRLTGTVDRISYRGEDSKILLNVEGNGMIEVLVNDVESYEEGESVTVGWPDDACHAFAAEIEG